MDSQNPWFSAVGLLLTGTLAPSTDVLTAGWAGGGSLNPSVSKSEGGDVINSKSEGGDVINMVLLC